MKTLAEIKGTKKAVLAFGRMNPPTSGHEKLVMKVLSVAKSEGAKPFIFVSHSQDAKKNPLTSQQKIKYLKLGVPSAEQHFVYNTSIKTIFDAMRFLSDKGYTDIILVAGDDRVSEFKKTITPYLNHPDPSKSLNISEFKVVSAGKRDPDADGVVGMSGTKMREAATENNFELFKTGVPSKLSDKFAKEMFNDIRQAMHVVEMVEEVQKLSGTLNIPRNKMPQIKGAHIPEFIKTLKSQGVSISKKDVAVKSLKPTQNEINLDKVKKKYDDYSNGQDVKPFIVSYDNYILDGHHQLFALKALDNDRKVSCFYVNITMKDLLNRAKDFPYTTYKQITD